MQQKQVGRRCLWQEGEGPTARRCEAASWSRLGAQKCHNMSLLSQSLVKCDAVTSVQLVSSAGDSPAKKSRRRFRPIMVSTAPDTFTVLRLDAVGSQGSAVLPRLALPLGFTR